ncbi:VanZ like family protein [Pseudobutyrivibrio sp. YE44]|uniref:VanZ family protein n=1 Tax=Pseudobutyrivibrio sp. YE44 TaxID=1520802 RepID=UPI00088733D1|nr:VanZ family protein [Pseudobutyrivibrio sp. YE44]SDB47147.1 VanZ like family protein [Pseudobutyrivibrio sp. YE44]
MKKRKVILGILIVAWVAFIWGHSMQTATVSDGESGVFLEFFSKFLPFLANNDDGMFIVRKAAHFTEYAVLGVLMGAQFSMFAAGKLRKFIEPAVAALMVSFVDETIQLFVEGRSGQVSDMWIDFAGASLGVIIALIMVYKGHRKRQ